MSPDSVGWLTVLKLILFVSCTFAIALHASAVAQESTSYTYDALGRLTGIAKSGGPANGTQATYSFDPAGNRSNVLVAGSPNGSGGAGAGAGGGGVAPGGGGTSSSPMFVVVPINGYSVIPVRD